MKNFLKILLSSIIILFFTSCQKVYFEDGAHSFFRFYNRSSLDIVVDVANSGCLSSWDVISVNKVIIGNNSHNHMVYANSIDMVLFRRHSTWESRFVGDMYCDKYDTVKIFILDADKIANIKGNEWVPFDSVFL